MYFHICDSHGCYLNLTTIIGALITTTVIIVVLKRIGNTTQESGSVTPHEDEVLMQADGEPSSRVSESTISTNDQPLLTPSIGQDLTMGKQTSDDLEEDSPKVLKVPDWRQLKAWDHLDQSSTEHLRPSSSLDSRIGTNPSSSVDSRIGTKLCIKDEPDTDSAVLSSFTFESRPPTPPLPAKTGEHMNENHTTQQERKQRKASPSRMRRTLPPAKRHKKQVQDRLSPQSSPRSVSEKVLHKKGSTPLQTRAAPPRPRSPKPPLRTMATTRPISPSFASRTRKLVRRRCMIRPKPPVPSQPPHCSQPITITNTLFTPYPLHRPCPLPSHEQPSPLPPYDRYTISRLPSNKRQPRDVHVKSNCQETVGHSQNQRRSHPYLKAKLLLDRQWPICGRVKSAKEPPVIHSGQHSNRNLQQTNQFVDNHDMMNVESGVESGGDEKAESKPTTFHALSPQDKPENEGFNIVKNENESSFISSHDYTNACQSNISVPTATCAFIMDDGKNAQDYSTTITPLPSVESTPTMATSPTRNNCTENLVENTPQEHLRSKQALNQFVQESDCTCGCAPTSYISTDNFATNAYSNTLHQNYQCQEKAAGPDEIESEYHQVNSFTDTHSTDSTSATTTSITFTCEVCKNASPNMRVESTSEPFCREHTNSRGKTFRCKDQTHRCLECNKSGQAMQQKEGSNARQVSSLKLLRYISPSPGRRSWTAGAMRSSFYSAHCDLCKTYPRYRIS